MILDLTLDFAARPGSSTEVSNPRPAGVFSQSYGLATSLDGSVSLASDSPFAVNLSTIPNVNVAILQASSKVRATITTADGASQVVPFSDLFAIVSPVPVTAISFTRVAGIASRVSFLLGSTT